MRSPGGQRGAVDVAAMPQIGIRVVEKLRDTVQTLAVEIKRAGESLDDGDIGSQRIYEPIWKRPFGIRSRTHEIAGQQGLSVFFISNLGMWRNPCAVGNDAERLN